MIINGHKYNFKKLLDRISLHGDNMARDTKGDGQAIIDHFRTKYKARLSRPEYIDIVSTHAIRYDFKRDCGTCKYCELCATIPMLREDLNNWKPKNTIGLEYKPFYIKE